MILIACVDQNWGIGKDDKLLFNIREDMKWFKEVTMNHNIIMGMNTLKSFPMSKPLPKRTNIILTTTNIKSCDPSTFYIKSISDLFVHMDEHNGKYFCIGGESVYKQLLPYCKEAYITFVYKNMNADKYLTNLDHHKDFELVKRTNFPNISFPNLVEQRFYVNTNLAERIE